MNRIPDILLTNGRRQVVFEHHWRPDFVGEALIVELGSLRRVIRIEFYSAALGIVSWHPHQGLGRPRGWETPEDSGVGIEPHFPCSLLNGPLHFSEGRKIVKRVVSGLGAPSTLTQGILSALSSP